MASLASIISKGEGRAGSNNSWCVSKKSSRYSNVITYMSVGAGSVSDQRGMNTLFQILGVRTRMRRNGGAHFEDY